MTVRAEVSPPGPRLPTLLLALLFVSGFSIIFVIGWGGAATLIGSLFGQYKTILGRVGGAIVIAFGLAMLGVLPIPWLYADTRRQALPASRYRSLNALLLGMIFAAGWTPCIGTTLGAILTIGMTQSGQGMLLSAAYSAGLALPFLALAIVLDRAVAVARRLGRYARAIQLASGVVLVLVGLLMVTGRMTLIAIWAQRNGYFLNPSLGAASAPTMVVALIAGLVSFLSPCVLPLVPAYLGYLSGQRLEAVA
jgi:cytochrome c-type biogenesis protein